MLYRLAPFSTRSPTQARWPAPARLVSARLGLQRYKASYVAWSVCHVAAPSAPGTWHEAPAASSQQPTSQPAASSAAPPTPPTSHRQSLGKYEGSQAGAVRCGNKAGKFKVTAGPVRSGSYARVDHSCRGEKLKEWSQWTYFARFLSRNHGFEVVSSHFELLLCRPSEKKWRIVNLIIISLTPFLKTLFRIDLK